MVNSWQFVFFNLQSATTHFLRKLSHPPPNIKQHSLHSLTFKTNFTHYDYKPSNSKKFFFKSVPLFPFSQNPYLQFETHVPDLKRTTSRSPLSPLLCYCCFCCLTFFSESVPAAQRLHLKTYYLMKKNKKFA